MQIFWRTENTGAARMVEVLPPEGAPARAAYSNIGFVEYLQKILEVAATVPRYRKAAQMGDATAAYWLGELFQRGVDSKGILQDQDQAAWWYRSAGELDHVEAQYNLALLCEKHEDKKQALEWYARATTQGHALARASLHIYAGLGHATAQLYLGLLYLSGRGVTKDEGHAAKLCRKAAEQGHGYAQYALGTMYADGTGVTKDYAEAAHWLMKAARRGQTAAREKLLILKDRLEADGDVFAYTGPYSKKPMLCLGPGRRTVESAHWAAPSSSAAGAKRTEQKDFAPDQGASALALPERG